MDPFAGVIGDETLTDDPPLPPLLSSLPDDISVQIIARLPLSCHPILSLVSRSWRAFFRLHSSYLFSTRTSLQIAKNFAILSLIAPFRDHPNPISYFLVDLDFPFYLSPIPLPAPDFPTVSSTAVTLGPEFFLLGGLIDGVRTSIVQIFDYRVKSWRLGPELGTPRHFASAGVIDGKIYVFGGCDSGSSFFGEVLDWGEKEHGRKVWVSFSSFEEMVVVDGKILPVAYRGGMSILDPVDERFVPLVIKKFSRSETVAVVDGFIFWLNKDVPNEEIKGYDQKNDRWMKVMWIGRRNCHSFPYLWEALTVICGRLYLVCTSWWSSGYDMRISMEMRVVFCNINFTIKDDTTLRLCLESEIPITLPVRFGSVTEHCVAVQM